MPDYYVAVLEPDLTIRCTRNLSNAAAREIVEDTQSRGLCSQTNAVAANACCEVCRRESNTIVPAVAEVDMLRFCLPHLRRSGRMIIYPVTASK